MADRPAERRLAQIRHLVLDLDGTIYADDELFETTPVFLEALRERGIGHTFITNNTSRSAEEHVAKLLRMGLTVQNDGLVTPANTVVDYLRANARMRIYVLGTPSLCGELEAAGLEIAEDSAVEEPEAVVVGFDTTLTYARLCRAAWWIGRGIPFVATHPDFVCPTKAPTVLVDCGAICAALTAATGRVPTAVLGKPDPAMIRTVSDRCGVGVESIAVVGDRLYTDIAMANRAGAVSVLVLTGEATSEDVNALPPESEQRPDAMFRDLDELRYVLCPGS